MDTRESTAQRRKRLGQWYTPADLVEQVVAAAIPSMRQSGPVIKVLDPACGDGRFLDAAARRIETLGGTAELTGVDVDEHALRLAAPLLGARRARLLHGDSLQRDWGEEHFDVVVGNPPFLSQMATSTTRGGASRHGGGPYADAAAEFLVLATRLARRGGGRIGLVLPQSILAARDTAPVRRLVDAMAAMRWCWSSPTQVFDANVLTCALVFERDGQRGDVERCAGGDFLRLAPMPAPGPWSELIAGALGVPELGRLATAGVLADRAALGANFRDEYYGMIPAVADDVDGPPLVTSGLIDPGRCRWGERPVRFAKRRFEAPRVALERLSPRMQRWAVSRLVPKVLVANQTRVIEAVADEGGCWLPGVPVTAVVPSGSAPVDVGEVAAVLTSPVASAWAWRQAAGSGLSAAVLRIGPGLLGGLPWPAGSLATAVAALGAGDIERCGRAVDAAYGIGEGADELARWWMASAGGQPPAPAAAARQR